MSSYRQRIVERYKRIFAPRPKESIAEWARKNIKISTKESADFPGDYDPDLNPLPTILFDAFQSGEYHRAVFKKSSQSGVTLAVLILICYFIRFHCRNFLYVIDSKDEMRRISKERLQPMLRSCGAVSDRITEDEDDFTNLTLSLRGCTGYLGGSNSMGVLANKSVGLAVNDETDTYKDKRAVELTKERGKKQSSFFHVELSKPENWEDTINQDYLIGTRHRCFYPCPHCGTMQTVEWERIKFGHCKDMLGGWDHEAMKAGIFLECISEECRRSTPGGITEGWKPQMIAGREWRPTNTGQDEFKPVPGVFSCEIDDLMSTFPKLSWVNLAREWIEAQGDEQKLKTFLQGHCAQAWKQKTIKVGDSDIYKMSGPYLRGHCPVAPWLVLMAVDRQKTGGMRKWVKCGFLRDGTCYVVDWGIVLSDGDLLREADTPVIVDAWDESTPADRRLNPVVFKMLYDEGFEQKEVRDFVVSTFQSWNQDGSPNYRCYSCWGQGGIHSRHLRDIVVPEVGAKANAVHNGWPIYAYRFSDDNFKAELYNQRIGRFLEIEAAKRENRPPPKLRRLWFPAQLDADFVAELCQERFVWSEKRQHFIWEDPSAPNDFGDALKMNLVAWYLVAPFAVIDGHRSAPEATAPTTSPAHTP